MAVVNRTSDFITNSDTSPPTLTSASASRGAVMEAIGTITPATDDSGTSIGRLVRVPSNARVSALTLSAADFTTAGVADIGVYYSTKNGGAVIDADFFASLLDFAASSGLGENLSVLNESTTNTLTKQTQPLWQAVGLSADPQCDLDIAYTITTAFNGGQQILCRCRYVV